MEIKKVLAVCAVVCLSSAVYAQESIQSAFNALVNNSSADVSASHSLDKDPVSGKKTSQCDIYKFTIPRSRASLVRDIERAFDRDREMAYTVSSGGNSNRSYSYTQLAVGNGKGAGVAISNLRGSRWTYACFMDKDDPDGIYRYAYAMEWREDKKTVTGRLIVTYATTLMYREGKSTAKKSTVVLPGDLSGDVRVISGSNNVVSNTLLGEFNMYKNLFIKNPDSSASSIYASCIYDVCKRMKQLNADERALVTDELRELMRHTSDSFIKKMFNSCIEKIK